MEESVLFNRACEFRSQRKYKKGFKLLLKGFERNDPFCCFELVHIYHKGGWDVKKNEYMHDFIFKTLDIKDVSLVEPTLTGTHSNTELYIRYLFSLKTTRILKKDDFIRHYKNLIKFSKQLNIKALRLLLVFVHDNEDLAYLDVDISAREFFSLILHVADQKNDWVTERVKMLEYKHFFDSVAWIEAKLCVGQHWHVKRLISNEANPIVLYTVGRVVYENKLTMFAEAHNALELFMNVTSRCRKSIIAWLLIAKELGIAKDIYVLIAKMARDMMRSEGAWGEEEEESIKKIKI